jgi:hypothetical protein
MCAIFLQLHLCQLQVLLLARGCLSLQQQRCTACSRQVLVVVVMLLADLCVVQAVARNVVRAVVRAVHEVLHAVVRGVEGIPGIPP